MENINTHNLRNADAESSNGGGKSQSKTGTGFRNLAAFHELLTRDGMCCPSINSKFVNKETLSDMYMGKIFRLRQEDIVFRECVKPPTKLVLVQKFLKYLAVTGAQSGIVMKRENFPDKRWLILAIATLSRGKDEIFDAEYMPSKPLAKVVQEQLDLPVFEHIMPHLQAKGRGRALRFSALTKEQKLQQKLLKADARIAKQQGAKQKIADAIGVMKSKDQEQIKWMQERERIRQEVQTELNQQAQNFVTQQIQAAHTQMYAEIERRVAERTGQSQQLSQLEALDEIPMSQNRSQMGS